MMPPSTKTDRYAWGYVVQQAREKARNELAMLHRDPITGIIHYDHASSTGLYRLPPMFMDGV